MNRLITTTAAAILVWTMTGCASTQTLEARHLPIPARQAPATPYALGDIVVSSQAASFDSTAERQNIESGLRIAANAAHLFGNDRSRMYRLSVTVVDFEIPFMDRGAFQSSLVMQYVLYDGAGEEVLQTTLRSVGQDDTGSLVGNMRARRSRTVAVSENIYAFTRLLEQRLDHKARPLFWF